MRYSIITLLLLLSTAAFAQWNPPPPPVLDPPITPIDAGLTALLVAGGVLGYRAVKKNEEGL